MEIVQCGSDDYTIIGDELVRYNGASAHPVIPRGVKRIGHHAFCGCRSLETITIPYGVTTIGVSAFQDCTGLKDVTIHDRVTEIGAHAFEGCRSLTGVILSQRLTAIGEGAFHNCTSLSEVSLPVTLVSIGEDAFGNCSPELTFNNLRIRNFQKMQVMDGTCLAAMEKIRRDWMIDGRCRHCGGIFFGGFFTRCCPDCGTEKDY